MSQKKARIIIGSAVVLFLLIISGIMVYYLGIKQDEKVQGKEKKASLTKTPEELSDLFEEYWQWRLKISPELASQLGVPGYNNKLKSYEFSSYKERYEISRDFLRRANKIEDKIKTKMDRLNLQLLKYDLFMFKEGYEYKGYFFPVTVLDGPQVSLELVVGYLSFDTEKDFLDLLSRYAAFPRQVEEIINLMKLGIREGWTASKYSMEGIEDQFNGLQVPYQDSTFYKPFLKIPSTIPATTSTHLQAKAKKVIEQELLPAFKKLQNFIMEEYMNHLRPEIGSSTLPKGMDFYQQCLKFHTSTNLTAEEIHRMGMREVERIEGEMKKIIKQLGFNDSVQEFSEKLRNNPEFFFNTKEELLGAYNELIEKRIIPRLPGIIKNIPKLKLNVEAMPAASEKGPGAYYLQGVINERPGVFAVNLANLKANPTYEMTSLALHEGYPGHHLQLSYLLETKGLPGFRTTGDGGCDTYSNAPTCFAIHTAYIEGWALYSEDLGFDLQLYEDLYSRYGHFSEEIFRACRLVVDTGLHALGWKQQQAVDFMRNHTASALSNIENEVNRYITWPGQACAYKVGELKIQELKEKAKQILIGKFNIKEFHDVILNCAGPLSIVEGCVDEYIQQNKASVFIAT